MSIAKNWCFTINNYDEDDLSRLSETYLLKNQPNVRYLVFQEEVGKEKKTPHLQGFLAFHTKKRISGAKKVVGDRASLRVADGSPSQNLVYCSKEDTRIPGTFTRFYGELPGQKGKRCDLEAFKDSVKTGMLSRKRLLEEHSLVLAKYPKFATEYVELHSVIGPVEEHPLHPWQVTLEARLAEPPDDRTLIFMVDEEGNKGKTWFAKRYCRAHDDAQYMEPGKKSDMAYALRTDKRVLFVNVARQQVEHIQYSFFESVKDGVVFSPKYESGCKYLSKMHVVFLMNEYPAMHFMSEDRPEIHVID